MAFRASGSSKSKGTDSASQHFKLFFLRRIFCSFSILSTWYPTFLCSGPLIRVVFALCTFWAWTDGVIVDEFRILVSSIFATYDICQKMSFLLQSKFRIRILLKSPGSGCWTRVSNLLFYKEKVHEFQQIYGQMWMKKMFNEGNKIHNFMSSSGYGTLINYGSGSGSDFLTSYGSITVPVPLVKKLRFLRFRFRFHNTVSRTLDLFSRRGRKWPHEFKKAFGMRRVGNST